MPPHNLNLADQQGHRKPEVTVAAPMKWGELLLPAYRDDGEVKFFDTAQSAAAALEDLAHRTDLAVADLRAIMDAIKEQDVSIEFVDDAVLLFAPAALIGDLMVKGLVDQLRQISIVISEENSSYWREFNPCHE